VCKGTFEQCLKEGATLMTDEQKDIQKREEEKIRKQQEEAEQIRLEQERTRLAEIKKLEEKLQQEQL